SPPSAVLTEPHRPPGSLVGPRTRRSPAVGGGSNGRLASRPGSARGADLGGVVLVGGHVDAAEAEVDEQVVEDLLHLAAVPELDLVAVPVAAEDAVVVEDLEPGRAGAAHAVRRQDEQVGVVGVGGGQLFERGEDDALLDGPGELTTLVGL